MPSQPTWHIYKTPGRFLLSTAQVGEDLVKHPFDGDGMVMAISFSKEGAYFRNRYVSGTRGASAYIFLDS